MSRLLLSFIITLVIFITFGLVAYSAYSQFTPKQQMLTKVHIVNIKTIPKQIKVSSIDPVTKITQALKKPKRITKKSTRKYERKAEKKRPKKSRKTIRAKTKKAKRKKQTSVSNQKRNKTLPKATKVLSRNNDSSQQNSTDFARIVRAKIKSNAGQKPRIAKKRGVGGTVYLHFTVSASGIATDISSSGDSMFAKSAKRALKQSVPFDTSKIHSLLPKSYTVPITYR